VASGNGPDFSDVEGTYKYEINMARNWKIMLPPATVHRRQISRPSCRCRGERRVIGAMQIAV
jgi:hypothetical protein